MLDPGTIAAIAVGATALTAAAGSCLAPLCRKQENSADQHNTTQDQDTVIVNYHGTMEHSFSCCGVKYSSHRDPQLTMQSNETDHASAGVKALRTAQGYQNYTSTQPRAESNITSGAASNLLPTPTLPNSANTDSTTTRQDNKVTPSDGATSSNTVSASDTTLLQDVDIRALSTIQPDHRNTYRLDEATRGPDGSWTIKGFTASVSPASDRSPKNTHIGRDIAEGMLPGLHTLLSLVTKEMTIQGFKHQQNMVEAGISEPRSLMSSEASSAADIEATGNLADTHSEA